MLQFPHIQTDLKKKVLDIEYVEILVLLKVLYSFHQKQLLYDLCLVALVSNSSPL